MRLQIELDDDLVVQIDALSGPQGRRAVFVRSAIERAIRQELSRFDIEAAAGAIDNQGHDWDADPAAWVRQQRREPRVEHWPVGE
jgi:hypothetical protein